MLDIRSKNFPHLKLLRIERAQGFLLGSNPLAFCLFAHRDLTAIKLDFLHPRSHGVGMDIHDIAPVDIDSEIAALEVERDDLKQDAKWARWLIPLFGIITVSLSPSYLGFITADQTLIVIAAATVYIGITEKQRQARFNQIRSEINQLKLWVLEHHRSEFRTAAVLQTVQGQISDP